MRKAGLIMFLFFTTFAQAQVVNLFKNITPISNNDDGNTSPFEISFDGIEPDSSIKDLRTVLAGYGNGKDINIQKVAIGNRTGQSFYISADPEVVNIKYTCQQSLDNAIYTYLTMLGINWYGPGANWLVKPATLNSVQILGTWKEPTFRNRSFFGTGGLDFGAVQSYDSTNSYKTKWKNFERRNRYNVDFQQTGHTGEAFYQGNRTLLDAHPEWFNSTSGKLSGRIKIEIPEAVQAYKTWVEKRYNTTGELFVTIGVDPEDGRGGSDDPLPPNGFAGIFNWNHADKWWWLANEVAKDYDENSKSVAVSMYAYGDGPTNALAPKFPLRKNVYPVVIPYAFQTAYLPKQMITTWESVVDGNMGIYDYWNITQWSLGLPQFDIHTIPQKLSFWNANKINGINQETTSASGPMGHVLWLAGQMEWDLTKNLDTLYGQYLKDCFGLAAPSMKKMYDRWSNNYQGTAEADFSLQNLHEATSLVAFNSPEWLRINDLKAYVHFMKLMYEHNNTSASRDSIFQYIYGINHLMLVQTAAFMGQSYIQPPDVRPVPTSSAPLTSSKIESQFVADYNDIKANYNVSPFVFNYDNVAYTDPIPNEAWLFGGFRCIAFFRAPFTGSISISVGAETTTPLQIFSDDGVLVDQTVGTNNFDFTEMIHGRTWSLKNFSLNIQAGKIYYIKTSYGFSRVKINTPGLVLFTTPGSEDFDNFSYPVKYFYVPIGTSEIAYFDAELQGANGRGYITKPDGTRLNRVSAGATGIYKVLVPLEDQGKVWSADFGHTQWSLKNIPNFAALQKFSYTE